MPIGDNLLTRADYALLNRLLADIAVPPSPALFHTRIRGGRDLPVLSLYDTPARLLRWFVDNKLTLTAAMAADHADIIDVLDEVADWVLIETGLALAYAAKTGSEVLTGQDYAEASLAASTLIGDIQIEAVPSTPIEVPSVVSGQRVVPVGAAEPIDADQDCSTAILLSDDGAPVNGNTDPIYIGDSTVTVAAGAAIRPDEMETWRNIRNLNELYCISAIPNQVLMWWCIR